MAINIFNFLILIFFFDTIEVEDPNVNLIFEDELNKTLIENKVELKKLINFSDYSIEIISKPSNISFDFYIDKSNYWGKKVDDSSEIFSKKYHIHQIDLILNKIVNSKIVLTRIISGDSLLNEEIQKEKNKINLKNKILVNYNSEKIESNKIKIWITFNYILTDATLNNKVLLLNENLKIQ